MANKMTPRALTELLPCDLPTLCADLRSLGKEGWICADVAAQHIEYQHAEIQRLSALRQPGGEWRDIASAPREGFGEALFVVSYTDEPGQILLLGFYEIHEYDNLTHWQPLPALPAAPAKDSP